MMLWVVIVLATSGAALFGYVSGYNTGVRETERRWSDAVGRKQHG